MQVRPLRLAGQPRGAGVVKRTSLRNLKESDETWKTWVPPRNLSSGTGHPHPVLLGVWAQPLPTHLSLSSSESTELRKWRLTCVTRARMSLPGKEPGPSLHESRSAEPGVQM